MILNIIRSKDILCSLILVKIPIYIFVYVCKYFYIERCTEKVPESYVLRY